MLQWKNRLTEHLLIRIMPIMAAILILLSIAGSFISGVVIDRLEKAEHHTVAKSFANALTNTLENTRNQLKSITQNDLIITGLIDTQERDKYIPTFFRSWRISGIDEGIIALLDYRGRPISSNNGQTFPDHIDWKERVLKKAETLTLLNESGLMIIQPILYQNGVEGAIGFYLKKGSLEKLFRFGSGKFSFRLRTPEGKPIYQDSDLFIQASTEKEQIFSYEFDHGIIDTIESENFTSNLRSQGTSILVLTVLLILLIGTALAFIAAKSATRTISGLSEKIQSIYKTMDLSIRLNYKNEPEELKELAEKFNSLLSKLENSTLSKHRMASILDSVNAYLIVYSCDGEIILNNRLFSDIQSEAKTTNHSPEKTVLGKEKSTVLKTKLSESSWQTAISTNKTIKIIEWSRSEFFNDQNELTGYIFVGIDISEKVTKENELIESRNAAERATKTKSEFLANMSHEIRTPMNAIIGMNELLFSSELQDRQFDYVSKSQNSAKNLLGLLNDILDFSKIEAGKLDIEKIDFDIQEVIESLSDLITVKESNIKSYFDIDPKLPRMLIGDPLRLNQILTNLIGNALKFTDSGHINFQIKVHNNTNDSVVLSFNVTDTGIGLSKEQAEKLFSPFTQADGSTTRRFGGTGLGLSISKVITELMGGRISVTSELGVGSKFTVEIPFKKSDQSSELKPAVHSLSYTFIDDWHVNRNIDELLSSMGISVIEITSISEIEDSQPAFLIIDDKSLLKLSNHGIPVHIYTLLLSYQAFNSEIHTKFIPPVKEIVQLPVTLLGLHRKLSKIETQANKPVKMDLVGCHILVVDDNIINREVAKELLAQFGAEIDEANDGKEAYDKTMHNHYDVILMDIHMPVMDGYESSYRINQSLKSKAPPIIALSAKAMEEDKLEAEKSGMAGYVSKPFDIKWLHKVIKETWKNTCNG